MSHDQCIVFVQCATTVVHYTQLTMYINFIVNHFYSVGILLLTLFVIFLALHTAADVGLRHQLGCIQHHRSYELNQIHLQGEMTHYCSLSLSLSSSLSLSLPSLSLLQMLIPTNSLPDSLRLLHPIAYTFKFL